MTNSERFNIVSENELTEVLAHFNTEFIMSIIDSAIANRANPTAFASNPNVVDAWDANFKQIINYYGSTDVTERVNQCRIDTYQEIIKRICTYHGLNFTVDEVDLYSAAHYLYQFFVSDFLKYMDTFFAVTIINDANELYDAMNLGNLKKNKDTSTIYSKKVFADPKIAIINANIDMVISYICGMDISLDQIFARSGLTMQEVSYMSALVSEQDNFFRNHYVTTIANDYVRPIRLNNIRFIIRSMAGTQLPESIVNMTVDSTDIMNTPLV